MYGLIVVAVLLVLGLVGVLACCFGLPRQRDYDACYARADELRELIPVGKRFDYLGRVCVCIGHIQMLPIAGTLPRPCIRYEHVDDNGVIQEGLINYDVAKRLFSDIEQEDRSAE